MTESLKDMLMRQEGRRATPYKDSVGVWTIGYGHNLSVPLPESILQAILDHDISTTTNDCLHTFPWFASLDPIRQLVILNMAFNLGVTGLSKFVHFCHAMELGDYSAATTHMLDSLWARQVPHRALELAHLLCLPMET